jgi:uncharacterized protein
VPVHVSIHDVSPASHALVDRAMRLCEDVGARPALLVVPDYHGAYPLAGDPAFCEQLRRWQDAGHPVFLHGFFHRARSRPPQPGLVPRLEHAFAQHVLSAGEAEMAGLTAAEGRDCVAAGERALSGAGLRIDGYVAPAWVMPRWLLPLLAERGYRYAEDHLRIHDPHARTARISAVLNWATRSRWRRVSSVGWCRIVRPARTWVPVRIAIHPHDLQVPYIEREVRRTLRWAAGGFVTRCEDLFR